MRSIDTQFVTRRHAALQPGTLHAALLERLTRTLGKNPESAGARDVYDALSLAVREELTLRWLATQRRVANAHVKRVCYFSVEYLPGRSLVNALSCLDGDLLQEARAALRVPPRTTTWSWAPGVRRTKSGKPASVPAGHVPPVETS